MGSSGVSTGVGRVVIVSAAEVTWMSRRKAVLGVLMTLGVAGAGGTLAVAQAPAEKAGAPAAVPTNCKAFGGKPCCDPKVAGHLPKEAVFKACGESDATFLGEAGSKDTCKYVFKVEGQKEDETFVQVYAPAQKEVPDYPGDPFFSWKKVGKVFITDKAKTPKAAPMMATSTGLWLPAKGYFVSVNASTKVCDKAQAKKLAPAMN
jgi:hypothetical protein